MKSGVAVIFGVATKKLFSLGFTTSTVLCAQLMNIKNNHLQVIIVSKTGLVHHAPWKLTLYFRLCMVSDASGDGDSSVYSAVQQGVLIYIWLEYFKS